MEAIRTATEVKFEWTGKRGECSEDNTDPQAVEGGSSAAESSNLSTVQTLIRIVLTLC